MDDVAREMARLRASDTARELAALRARLDTCEEEWRNKMGQAAALHTVLAELEPEHPEIVQRIRYAWMSAQPVTAEPARPAPRRRVWEDDAGPRDDGIEGPEDGFYVS